MNCCLSQLKTYFRQYLTSLASTNASKVKNMDALAKVEFPFATLNHVS